MTTFEQIQERHRVLEKALAEPDSVRTGQITSLLAQIQETAVSVANEEQRQTLVQILTHWASVAEQRGEEPVSTVLAAYQPPVPPPAAPPPPPPDTTTVTVSTPPPAVKAAPPRRPLINWSNPPEWMLQGLTLLIIAVLALGSYYILAYYFDTEPADPLAEGEPTLEPTLVVDTVVDAETAVNENQPTPTAVLVEVIAIDAAPTAATNAPQRSHIVGPGDTLTTIATRYGVAVEAIIAANTLLNPNQLEVGQTLSIPFANGSATPVGTAVAAEPIPPLPTAIPEVVLRGADITAVIPLYINPSTASQPIATLTSGTFAKAIGLSEDRSWYLVELSDGITRGWVTVDSAELLYPAIPDQLPLLRVVNP